jgi:hypothetical protein
LALLAVRLLFVSFPSRIATVLAATAGDALVTASPALAGEVVDVESDAPVLVVEGPLVDLG